MGLGPIEAWRQTLARANMTIDEIDLVEINEAFAAQVIPSAKHLERPPRETQHSRRGHRSRPPLRDDRCSNHDHLLNSLEDADKRFGLESMCVGGGQGMAMIVERLDLNRGDAGRGARSGRS